MKYPWKLVIRQTPLGRRRMTMDGRFNVFGHLGMFWAAKKPCDCPNGGCFCPVLKLPGGIAGTGFEKLKDIQEAIRKQFYVNKTEEQQ